MRYVYFYFPLIVFCLIFNGCGKEANEALAKNYYKLSMLELSNPEHPVESLKIALNYIDTALEQVQDSKYLALKASILFQLGQLEESEEIFCVVLKRDLPSRLKTEILNNYACLLAQKGYTDKAQKIWSDLEFNKDYLTPEVAIFNQSKIFFESKNFEKAKRFLLKAINIEPNYIDARYYLAQTFVKLCDFSAAKRELNEILFLAPGHEKAKKLSNSIIY